MAFRAMTTPTWAKLNMQQSKRLANNCLFVAKWGPRDFENGTLNGTTAKIRATAGLLYTLKAPVKALTLGPQLENCYLDSLNSRVLAGQREGGKRGGSGEIECSEKTLFSFSHTLP